MSQNKQKLALCKVRRRILSELVWGRGCLTPNVEYPWAYLQHIIIKSMIQSSKVICKNVMLFVYMVKDVNEACSKIYY